MPFAVPDEPLQIRPSVTVAQAARALSCDPSLIRRLLRKGDLAGHRVGSNGVRIYADSITAYQRRREIVPTEAPKKPKGNQSASHRAAVAALRAAGVL